MTDQNVHINVTGTVGGNKAQDTQFTYHSRNGQMMNPSQLVHLNNQLMDKVDHMKVSLTVPRETSQIEMTI